MSEVRFSVTLKQLEELAEAHKSYGKALAFGSFYGDARLKAKKAMIDCTSEEVTTPPSWKRLSTYPLTKTKGGTNPWTLIKNSRGAVLIGRYEPFGREKMCLDQMGDLIVEPEAWMEIPE